MLSLKRDPAAIVNKKDFAWTIGFNTGFNQNRVLELPDGEDTEEEIPDKKKVSDITDNSGPAEAAREQETSAAENRPEGENE